MARSGIAQEIPRVEQASAEEIFSRERNARDVCEERIGDANYLNTLGRELPLRCGSERSSEAVATALVEQLSKILGTPRVGELGQNSDCSRTLVAMVPVIRSQLMWGIDTSHAKTVGSVFEDAECLNLAVLGACVIAETAWMSGVADIGFQTVSGIVRQHYKLLYLVSVLARRVSWDRNQPIRLLEKLRSDTDEALLLILKEILESGRSDQGAVLGEIIEAFLPPDAVARVQLLRDVAELAYGNLRLHTSSGTDSKRPWRGRTVAQIEQWVLRRATTDGLRSARQMFVTQRSFSPEDFSDESDGGPILSRLR
jgi:hypothetical protein